MSIFNDLNRLRLETDPAGLVGAREELRLVPVRKPLKHEYFRANPSADYQLTTGVFEDKSERETYFVDPSLWAEFSGDLRPVQLVLCVSRQSVLFIWPVPMPDPSGRLNSWHETAREAFDLAQGEWVRMSADMQLGGYRIYRAVGTLPDPTWPEKTFSELLQIAFRGRVIDRQDHPVLRRLRGET